MRRASARSAVITRERQRARRPPHGSRYFGTTLFTLPLLHGLIYPGLIGLPRPFCSVTHSRSATTADIGWRGLPRTTAIVLAFASAEAAQRAAQKGKASLCFLEGSGKTGKTFAECAILASARSLDSIDKVEPMLGGVAGSCLPNLM